MTDEYDFTNAERSKFDKAGLRLVPPLRPEPAVPDDLAERASPRETSPSERVNALPEKKIERIEAAK